MIEGIVLSRTGGRYRVWAAGRAVEASLRGRMRRRDLQRVLVGDRVRVVEHPDAGATIEGVLERRSVLRRRSPGKSKGVREIAANVEQVVVVGAACQPEWDPYSMDRFLAVAAANGLAATLVINKLDLDQTAARHAAPYRQAGYSVQLTSAAEQAGIGPLRDLLAGSVTLFAGPSGVGKSSLLNAIQAGLGLRTAAVSRKSGTGRHTTVAAEMHPLVGGGGGFVVDTPGLRDVGLWGMERAEVAAAFPEIARRAALCRFDNCRHGGEPDCAVRSAVGDGSISSSRYDSYRRMLEEAERAARHWE